MTYARNRSPVGKVWNLLTRPERKGALVLLGMMLVGMLLETLGIGLVIPAILLITQDDLGSSYPATRPLLELLGNPSQKTLIVMALLTLVGVYLIKTVYLGILTWLQARYILSVRMRLSKQLFTVYLRQPFAFHLQRNSNQLVRNVLTEVHHLTSSVLTPVLQLFAEGAILLGIATLLLVLEPTGFLIVAASVGTAAWIFQSSTRSHLISWGQARQYHEGLRVQHLRQGLGAAKDVKLLGREKEFLARFEEHDRQAARVARLEILLRQMPRLWLELLAVLGMAILVLTMLYQGRQLAAIVPTLAVFAAAAFRLLPSVNKLLTAQQQLRFGFAALDGVDQELGLPAPPLPSGSDHTPLPFTHELQVNGVNYSYPGSKTPALKNACLTIRAGESVGFIGPSGSGKSTLIDVILGLFPPASGTVSVDGRDVQQDLRAWQDQIGYVPQSIYLTDDTLRRNVAFGLPEEEIDDAAVEVALRAAQLETFVANLPEGLATMVGEHGVRLSGGQRQRIGIARALYHDPAVLVLDEATSSLDTATEREVMQSVYALQGDKTILIVAHRMTTVERCDHLYRLEDGRVLEERGPVRIVHSSHAEESLPARNGSTGLRDSAT